MSAAGWPQEAGLLNLRPGLVNERYSINLFCLTQVCGKHQVATSCDIMLVMTRGPVDRAANVSVKAYGLLLFK